MTGHPLAGVVIRPLTSTDSLEALTSLLHRAYASLAAQGWNYTAVDQTVETTRDRAERGTCLVAERDGVLVGTIVLADPGRITGTPLYERPGTAVVGQFAVEPSLQGSGLGAALMDEVERLARARGVTTLAGDTSSGAAHLIAFYERRGFREVARARWKGKTYESVVMAKDLSGDQAAEVGGAGGGDVSGGARRPTS